MAIITTDSKHYKDIAAAIRSNSPLGKIGDMKPKEMASNIGTIAQENFFAGETAGYGEGKADGKSEGIAEGKQAEYDRFWDLYQDNGARTTYEYAFANWYWDKRTFTPKYDMRPTTASNMFRGFGRTGTGAGDSTNIDLVEHLKTLGVTLDFSQCATFTTCFMYAVIKRVGVIDTRAASGINQLLASADIEQIDELILRDDGSQTFSNVFTGTSTIKEIRITGVIGKNGFNVQWSTELSHDSIVSIINALSTTTSGLSVTLSKTAVNKAFEQLEGANDGASSAEWQDLIATRSNWTISLI